MSKAILILDMPSCCRECSIMFADDYSYWCPVHVMDEQTDVFGYMSSNTRPNWCPLKEFPEKHEVCGEFTYEQMWGADEKWAFEHGWNACLKEILGE